MDGCKKCFKHRLCFFLLSSTNHDEESQMPGMLKLAKLFRKQLQILTINISLKQIKMTVSRVSAP